MTNKRRGLINVALATAGGIGLGFQVSQLTISAQPVLGLWVALFAVGAMFALYISSPIVTGDVTLVAGSDAGWTEFRRELRRARRGARPLTFVRLPGDEVRSEVDLDGRPIDLTARSRRLATHLRLVDRTWVDDGSIYVLLPESPRSAADVLIQRVDAAEPGWLPANIRVATFPEDGLTSGAIIAAVHDAAFDAVPIPIRTSLVEGIDMAPYGLDDDLAGREAAGGSR